MQYELHRQLRVAGLLHVSTNAVHPGIVDTELPRFLPANFYPLMKCVEPLTLPSSVCAVEP